MACGTINAQKESQQFNMKFKNDKQKETKVLGETASHKETDLKNFPIKKSERS